MAPTCLPVSMLLFATMGILLCSGHAILGTPIGAEEFISYFAQHAVDEAIRFHMLISELLLDRDSTGADETRIFL